MQNLKSKYKDCEGQGSLESMGLQRVRHDCVTKQQ